MSGNAGRAIVRVRAAAAAAAAAFALAVSCAAPAWADVRVDEYAGADRYGTAAEIAEAEGPHGGVLVATGSGFADALGAGGLSGLLGYPVVLVDGSADALGADARASLDSVTGGGRAEVIAIGGASAVSDGLLSELAAWDSDGAVERIGGADRYATNVNIYRFGAARGGWRSDTAVVATGASFPDALAASPYAAWTGAPVLLADPERGLSPDAASALSAFSTAVVAGGEAAVSAETYGRAAEAAGSALRLAGQGRCETAAEFSRWAVAQGMSYEGAGFATCRSFPDALAAGFLLGERGSVLLLCDPDDAQGCAEIAAPCAGSSCIALVGGALLRGTAAGSAIVAAVASGGGEGGGGGESGGGPSPDVPAACEHVWTERFTQTVPAWTECIDHPAEYAQTRSGRIACTACGADIEGSAEGIRAHLALHSSDGLTAGWTEAARTTVRLVSPAYTEEIRHDAQGYWETVCEKCGVVDAHAYPYSEYGQVNWGDGGGSVDESRRYVGDGSVPDADGCCGRHAWAACDVECCAEQVATAAEDRYAQEVSFACDACGEAVGNGDAYAHLLAHFEAGETASLTTSVRCPDFERLGAAGIWRKGETRTVPALTATQTYCAVCGYRPLTTLACDSLGAVHML